MVQNLTPSLINPLFCERNPLSVIKIAVAHNFCFFEFCFRVALFKASSLRNFQNEHSNLVEQLSAYLPLLGQIQPSKL